MFNTNKDQLSSLLWQGFLCLPNWSGGHVDTISEAKVSPTVALTKGNQIIQSGLEQSTNTVMVLLLAVWTVCMVTCFRCFLFFVWIRQECL